MKVLRRQSCVTLSWIFLQTEPPLSDRRSSRHATCIRDECPAAINLPMIILEVWIPFGLWNNQIASKCWCHLYADTRSSNCGTWYNSILKISYFSLSLIIRLAKPGHWGLSDFFSHCSAGRYEFWDNLTCRSGTWSTRIGTSTLLARVPSLGPPLCSGGQSSWLLTQRSRFRFPTLPHFLTSSGSGTGSTQPLWG
jgi:hypothetical protein